MRNLLRSLLFGSAIVFQSLYADLTVEERVEDFQYFWQTYKDAYVFFDLKKEDYGIAWESVREQMLQRLEASESDMELYAAVTEAQAMLRDGHCYNGAFTKIRETEPIFFQRIQFRLVEGKRIAVAGVVAGTEFAEAGVEMGDELVQFDGKSIRQLASDYRPLQAASSEGQFWNSLASQLYIHSPLLGKPKSPKAKMVFRKADGQLVEVEARWNMAPATGAQKSTSSFADDASVDLSQAEQIAIEGPLPMDVRIFKDVNIGYVAIETWMKTEDPIEQMEQVMTAMKGTEGLIVDMRGNGGGVGPWGVLFTNYFLNSGAKSPNDSWMDRKLSKAFFRASFPQLGEKELEEVFTSPETIHYVLTKAFGLEVSLEEVQNEHFKDGRFQPYYLRLLLNERTNTVAAYDKPVYVLTDGGCYSTTDIFLTILDEFDRITIVGSPNGAGSGSPIPFTLPNSGLQVYVPHARAYPPFGSMIEGRPRQPDILVTQTMEDLRQGRDTVLITAAKALWEEINPAFSSFSNEAFELGAGDSIMNTLSEKTVDWGNIPTPDWAIDAKIRHKNIQELDLLK